MVSVSAVSPASVRIVHLPSRVSKCLVGSLIA
jgi:hypothetical protein